MSPILLRYLSGKAPPSQEEQGRLIREEVDRHAYIPQVERVLVPIIPSLRPEMVSVVVERIARVKHEENQIFDITELVVEAEKPEPAPAEVQAMHTLDAASGLKEVELTQQRVEGDQEPVQAILDAIPGHALLAIGAYPPTLARITFGRFQDDLIHRSPSNVLVVTGQIERWDWPDMRRILVPTNGFAQAMAAGDLAAALAKSCDAELVVLHVLEPEPNRRYRPAAEWNREREEAFGVVEKLAVIACRLGVRGTERIAEGRIAGEVILGELDREPYQLVALGGVDRGSEDPPYLGRTIQTVLTEGHTPSILLVSHLT